MITMLIIALAEFFSIASADGSSSPPQGFACPDKKQDNVWSLEEKALITTALGNKDFIFFDVPEKVVHKEQGDEEHCIYIGKNLAIGFSEPKSLTENVGRVKVSLAGARDKSVISYEYRFYRFERRGEMVGSQLKLLFTFFANAGTGLYPLAWFSHNGFLGQGVVYTAVVIIKNQDGKQYVFAQKASPK
ncbi:MAG: hypothetical protein AABY73_03165 [Pseudomonadota bacterium]